MRMIPAITTEPIISIAFTGALYSFLTDCQSLFFIGSQCFTFGFPIPLVFKESRQFFRNCLFDFLRGDWHRVQNRSVHHFNLSTALAVKLNPPVTSLSASAIFWRKRNKRFPFSSGVLPRCFSPRERRYSKRSSLVISQCITPMFNCQSFFVLFCTNPSSSIYFAAACALML
jgi:hypothetical protein